MHIESEPTMIMPGEIGQVFHAFDLPVTIEGFATEEGAIVTQVIAGKGGHRPEAPARSVEGLNLPLPGGSFAIALVKNASDTPRAIKGTWTIKGEAKVKAPAAELAKEPAIPESIERDGVRYFREAPTQVPSGPKVNFTGNVDPWAVPTQATSAVDQPPQVTGPSVYTVPNPPQPPTPAVYVEAPAVANVARTAGANEVAVYLTIGEVTRLADIVADGRILEQGERWGVVRKLRAAIGK